MMILQGVGHPVPYLGVSYANDPQKGGYMAYAPALDLTTLFEVILDVAVSGRYAPHARVRRPPVPAPIPCTETQHQIRRT